ncbi:antibiotic biosynthesis monooxygenase [Cupriavidus sp. USMAA2-4]|uniref:Antibiotic biosynthesis monooxygenase n=1 Tax=Cupriavidus malaysiensis TaxID=367825 RepID=A0ABM6F459_9BURK|nr:MULTISPECIES: putative quinol monooxygenase [Cupriavidus]AOY90814.1 antibiotic biosynthesis monooxygenase [Cupriavidus sp. USMAA2-4]AOY99585.1 antibiotic biosynthesis monooxygenase [Cupriavidus sp. USMAHM13]AOZ06233.1 antibiotic biosynthesis monooxygenase [Cupriavidus malaysiensis]
MSGTYTLVGIARAKANRREVLVDKLTSMRQRGASEPGCLRYHVGQDAEDHEVFVLYMVWDSKRALESHLNSEYVRDFHAMRDDYLDGDIHFRWLQAA